MLFIITCSKDEKEKQVASRLFYYFLGFSCDGSYPKRSCPSEGAIVNFWIESLFLQSQCGCNLLHPGAVRYWSGLLLHHFP